LPQDFDIYIETFGSKDMAKYHRDTIFIMPTGTPSTIVLGISSVSQLKNIVPTIVQRLQMRKGSSLGSTAKESDPSPKSGTPARKVASGTAPTEKRSGKTESQKTEVAKSVGKTTQPGPQDPQDFVRINVSQNGVEIIRLIMSKENALIAKETSALTSIPSLDSAPPPAPENDTGWIDVYNLHVDNEHEFFAEGILVSNCMDSLRYAAYTHFRSVLTSDDDHDIDKIYADVVGFQSDFPGFFRDTAEQGRHAPQMPAVGHY